jgi:hypothetical protein
MLGDMFTPFAFPFEIDSRQCYVQFGDRVMPETIIGQSSESGNLVQAGCQGLVTGVEYNGTRPVITIFVMPDQLPWL